MKIAKATAISFISYLSLSAAWWRQSNIKTSNIWFSSYSN